MENSMFPRNCTEALAMLYVQNMSSNGATPEEMCQLYWDAYFRISNSFESAYENAKAKYSK